MKKAFRLLSVLSICILLFTAAGCNLNVSLDLETVSGSGNTIISPFKIPTKTVTELEVKDLIMISGNPGKVIVRIINAGEPYLTINTDDNIMSQLTVETDDGKLLVAGKHGTNYKTDGVVIEITGVTFENADLVFSGNTQLTAENCIYGDTLDLTANGAIDGTMALSVGSADITLNGATKLSLSGKADDLSMTINGTGKTDSTGLEAKSVTATINGAGSADVFATDTLKAVINGAGSVSYKGSPTVTQKVNGLGSVKQLK